MPSYQQTAPFMQGIDAVLDATCTGLIVDVPITAIGSIATLYTPPAGKKFRLLGGLISVSGAANVLFEDNAAGAANYIFRVPALAVNTPCFFSLGRGRLSAAADNVLKATSSAAANITGVLYVAVE